MTKKKPPILTNDQKFERIKKWKNKIEALESKKKELYDNLESVDDKIDLMHEFIRDLEVFDD